MSFSKKIKKQLSLLLFGMVVFSGVLFFDMKDSFAAAKLGSCSTGGADAITIGEVDNQKECDDLCNLKGQAGCAFYLYNTPAQNQAAREKAAGAAPTVKKIIGGIFTEGVMFVLTGIQSLVGWLFAIAATLFAWVIHPDNISGPNGMLNKQAVKDVWVMVRDTLNMLFILVLLFASFCTIFQISKWNLKSVWLNILINALLVNFSYPIARFFIDVSNVAFYYLVNHLFTSTGVVSGSSIFASFGTVSNISAMLSPPAFAENQIPYTIVIILVLFLMGMTLLIIAGMFVVRLVALTMLVMFSPIGFVGYILPETRGYAEKWWKELFSYSFFAPIMIFMMAVSLHILEALQSENFKSMVAGANANADQNQANFIASAAFFVIPVATMWYGIGMAKSSGGQFASTIVDKVQKGGNWLATRPWAAGKYAWKQSGVPGGVKKGLENARKSGKLFGVDNKFTQFALKDGREGREAGITSVMGKKKGETFKAAYDKAGIKSHNTELDEDIKKAVENFDAETTDTLRAHLDSTSTQYIEAMDSTKRKEAVDYMAKYKQLMGDPIRKQEHEAKIRVSALSTMSPTVSSMPDGSEKTAAIEAHVQERIASSYSQLKTNYQQVKGIHKK